MTVNKAELVNQIISSSNLHGDALEKLKRELMAKTVEELSSMLSNSSVQAVKFKNFVELPAEDNRFSGNIWNSATNGTFDDFLSINKSAPAPEHEKKKLSAGQERDAREFAKNYLADSMQQAKAAETDYAASYAITDRIWSGMKKTANLLDFSRDGKAITTFEELHGALSKEYQNAQKIKNSKQKGAFEYQFEKARGMEFDAAKMLDFKEKSENYLELSIYKEKAEKLAGGVKELEKIHKKEQALELLRQSGQNIPESAYPDVDFKSKFAQIINDYCNGDEKLKKEVISQISGNAASKSSLPPNEDLLKSLKGLSERTNSAFAAQLGSKSFAEHEKDYQNAYKAAFGGENAKEAVQRWVETQKMGAAGVKIGAIVVSTMLLGGSNLAASGTARLAQTVGTKSAVQLTKLGLTSFGVGEGVAIDYADAFSSHAGLTKEKNAQILAAAKESLPYAFFGAYVSGPLGNKIAGALKSSGSAPKILEKAFNSGSKAADFTAEIGADTLFELAISDHDFMSVLQNNATGESQGRLLNKFGAMIIGGRANASAKAALRNAGLEKARIHKAADNKYELITSDGKNYIADSAEALIGGIFAKVSETADSSAKTVKESPTNPFNAKNILENDQINQIKQPDAGIPSFKGAKSAPENPRLNETAAPSPEEFKNVLKSLNFTDEEIKSIDLNDKEAGMAALGMKFMSEFTMAGEWDFSDAGFRSEITNLFKNPDFSEMKAFRYMNKENISMLEKYVKFPDDASLLKVGLLAEVLNNSSNPAAVIEKLPLFAKMSPDGKLDSNALTEISWFNADNLEKFTGEMADIAGKINSQVPQQYRVGINEIANTGNVSDAQIARYVSETERLSKFSVDFNLKSDDVNTLSTRMSAISDMLEKYPMDLRTESGENVPSFYLEELAGRKDLPEIQKFVNTLSPAAKEDGLRYITQSGSPIKAPEIAEMYNIINSPDYGKCDIDMREIEKLGITDYAGFRDLVKAMKGTNALEYSHRATELLDVKSGDYKGAAAFMEKIKTYHKKQGVDAFYVYGAAVRNPDFSFKNALATLDYVEKNNLSLTDNAYSVLADKNAVSHLKMVDYMQSKGFENPSRVYKELSSWNPVDFETFKAKIDLITAGNKFKDAYSCAKAASNNLTLDEFSAVLREHPISDSSQQTIQALAACIPENKKLAMKLFFDKEINANPDEIFRILLNTREFNVDLANKLCFSNEYDVPKNQIPRILMVTSADNIELAKNLCSRSDFPKDKISQVLSASNKDNKPLIEQVLGTDGLNKSCLSDILDSLVLKDGINHGKVDTNKVKRYTNLLQNPKTSPFVVKMLNEGMDINTAAFLSKTQQKLDAEKAAAPAKSAQKSLSDNMSADQKDVFALFEANGFSEKESASVLKAISTEGVVDAALQAKALEIAKSGVQKNKIGDIINSAKISGEYNPKIVDDFMALQNTGLNPLLEKNLAVLNNISGADVAVKFNSKVKKQIKGMIQGLSLDVRSDLQTKGIDIEAINAKLDAKIVKEADGVPQKAKVVSGLRSRQNIKGFERIVIDKYNPDDKIWRNEAATRDWAQNQYDSIKNGDYQSRTYSKANEHRDKMLKEWFDFMDNEPDLKENIYAKIIVADFITKDLLPENADIPPQLDKTLVKEILGSAANSSNTSFSNLYSQRIREKAMNGSNVEAVDVDGIKGKWYTVPQTDSSSPDYNANVDKVKAFSDGTNWCIRTFNAEPYVKQGAMHFFVDENGLTQVCVRETAPGSVYEIQKRQQNATVPIPYINVINDYMSRNGLSAQPDCKQKIDKALASKPIYDDLRATFQNDAAQKNYGAIFEKMEISVTKQPDGTFSLSHYNPNVGGFTLSELGVKENDLLANVSNITGDADFKNSNATSLPNLKEVGGKFIFDESNLSDVRSLKEINGYKIDWGIEDFQQKMQNLDILNDEAGLDYVLAQWKADLDSIDKIKNLEEYNALMPTVREKYSAIQEKIFDLQFNGAPENRAKAAKIFEEKFMPVIDYSTEVFARIDNRKDIKGSYNL